MRCTSGSRGPQQVSVLESLYSWSAICLSGHEHQTWRRSRSLSLSHTRTHELRNTLQELIISAAVHIPVSFNQWYSFSSHYVLSCVWFVHFSYYSELCVLCLKKKKKKQRPFRNWIWITFVLLVQSIHPSGVCSFFEILWVKWDFRATVWFLSLGYTQAHCVFWDAKDDNRRGRNLF